MQGNALKLSPETSSDWFIGKVNLLISFKISWIIHFTKGKMLCSKEVYGNFSLDSMNLGFQILASSYKEVQRCFYRFRRYFTSINFWKFNKYHGLDIGHWKITVRFGKMIWPTDLHQWERFSENWWHRLCEWCWILTIILAFNLLKMISSGAGP